MMERCVMCEEEKREGIHLHVLFICRGCEWDIIHTHPSHVRYDYYIQKLTGNYPSAIYS